MTRPITLAVLLALAMAVLLFGCATSTTGPEENLPELGSESPAFLAAATPTVRTAWTDESFYVTHCYAHAASSCQSGAWKPVAGRVYVYRVLNSGSSDRTVVSFRGNNVSWRIVGTRAAKSSSGIWVRQTVVVGVATSSASTGRTQVTLSGSASRDLYIMPEEWTGIDPVNPVAKVVTGAVSSGLSVSAGLYGPSGTVVALGMSLSGHAGEYSVSPSGMVRSETHYVGTTADGMFYGLSNYATPRVSWISGNRAAALVAVALRRKP